MNGEQEVSRQLQIWRAGRIAYDDALALQKSLIAARTAAMIPDTLLLLEHPPTITLGRGAKEENLLLSPDALAEAGVAVHDIGRGGDVTYHGPGQLVGYPIIDLKPDRMDVRKYVASLEETMIRCCADYGLEAERLEKFNGTWIEPHGFRPRKIGAVGVRISRWVTMHGFALNVAPQMSHFGMIVPCGIVGKGVTSLALEVDPEADDVAAAPTFEAVQQSAGDHFAQIHEYASVSWHDGRPTPPAAND